MRSRSSFSHPSLFCFSFFLSLFLLPLSPCWLVLSELCCFQHRLFYEKAILATVRKALLGCCIFCFSLFLSAVVVVQRLRHLCSSHQKTGKNSFFFVVRCYCDCCCSLFLLLLLFVCLFVSFFFLT